MEDHHYQFLTSFITIGLGYVSKKLGVLLAEDAAPVSRLLYGLLVPMLIMGSMTQMPIQTDYLLYMGIAGTLTVVSILTAFAIFGRRADRETRGILVMASIGYSLPFGIPLIQSVWGTDGLLLAFLFDIPNVFAIFGFKVLIAQSYSPLVEEVEVETVDKNPAGQVELNQPAEAQQPVQETEVATPDKCSSAVALCFQLARNAPFMAVVIAMSLNISGVGAPDYILALSKSMGVAVTPVILLLSGLSMDLKCEVDHLWLLSQVLGLRIATTIAYGALVLSCLSVSREIKSILIMHACCPISNTLLRYAIVYGYNRKLAATMVNVSMLISFFMLWAIATFI